MPGKTNQGVGDLHTASWYLEEGQYGADSTEDVDRQDYHPSHDAGTEAQQNHPNEGQEHPGSQPCSQCCCCPQGGVYNVLNCDVIQ